MFHAGEQIGQYTLIRKLGRGGFGEVWLAERKSQFFIKKVAVKLPHDEQVDFETIRREAQLWEEASGHPNVLPIIDADIYDGQVVIVSEFADGGSLADKIKTQGTLPLKQAFEMTIGILNGLQFLHHKKIIHRDIKPQNILLQGDTPRLADFGISRAMNTSTISSVVVGTDAYMSPEAFDGKRNVQTDVWSVGVVLYQLLKGSLPFPQEHPSERMFAVLTKEFAPLPVETPFDLQQIVQKALAKDPGDRFQTAGAMREDLQKALLNINRPAMPTEPIQKPDLPLFYPPAIAPQQSFQTNIPPKNPAPVINDQSVVTNFPAAPHSTAKSVVTTLRTEKPNANPLKKILLAAAAGLVCMVAALGYFFSNAGRSSETTAPGSLSSNKSANSVNTATNSANSFANSATTQANSTENKVNQNILATNTLTNSEPAANSKTELTTKTKTASSATPTTEKPAREITESPPANSQRYGVKPIPGFTPAAKAKADRRNNSRDSEDEGIRVVDDPDGVFLGTPRRKNNKPSSGNVNSMVVRRPQR